MDDSEKRDLVVEMKKIKAEYERIMNDLYVKLKAIESDANNKVVTDVIEGIIENIFGGKNGQDKNCNKEC